MQLLLLLRQQIRNSNRRVIVHGKLGFLQLEESLVFATPKEDIFVLLSLFQAGHLWIVASSYCRRFRPKMVARRRNLLESICFKRRDADI